MSDKIKFEKIAVVAIGGVFPDAPETQSYWKNILNKKVSIGPVKEQIFDRNAHFDPDVYGKPEKNDKSYTEIGSSAITLNFDGLKFRIPPATSKHMDENQKAILISVDEALKMVDSSKWNRDKVSIFIGTSLGGPLHYDFQRRVNLDRYLCCLKKSPEFNELPENKQAKVISDIENEIRSGTFPVTEDSAPGILPNIVAARVAATFDFHGHSYTVDAACASSLAAVINGIQHLSSGESDVVICGGADTLNGEMGRIYFSGINALSPTGSYPFDVRANGFVIGEGGGIVILKRLSDAVADGDTILSTIIGYGHNSDGKGKSIAAPNFKYQAKAIQQAIEMSTVPADTIELIEAHGTSTVVGDKSEIDALKLAFESFGVKDEQFCAVGSAKSNIGHLKTAAGIAGLIKTILAIKNKILPPSANCVTVNPALGLEKSPFYINTEVREWKEKAHPRRAGVSAFGFGGANCHVLIEEFRSDQYIPTFQTEKPEQHRSYTLWCSGEDKNSLDINLRDALANIIENDNVRIEKLTEANYKASIIDRHRLSFYFDSADDLKRKVEFWEKNRENVSVLKLKGIFYKESEPVSSEKTAFLFPGQGSQYPDMLLNLQSAYPSTLQTAVPMDLFWKDLTGERIRDLIDSTGKGKEHTESILKNTRNTHPAMMYSSLVMFKVLQDLGVHARYMIGHSLGELIALTAAGAVSHQDALRMMDHRSRSFIEMKTDDPGKMIALRNDLTYVSGLIQKSRCEVYPANINSPEQTIVSGTTKSIDEFCRYIKSQNGSCVELKVSHAFHSPVVKNASDQFSLYLDSVTFVQPGTTVYSNELCATYPNDPSEIRNVLKNHIIAPVNFAGSIESLYEKGVRLFIEIGPGTVLSKLTQSILTGKECTIISTNNKDGNEIESLQKALAQLFVDGVHVRYLPPADMPKNNAPVLNTSAIEAVKQNEIISEKSKIPQPVYNENKISTDKNRRVVYSGVSVGLPGSYKKSFQDDNFEQLFEGRNFIERLTDEEKQRLVELNITKVEKTAQGPVFTQLDSLNNVIQLAGKLGKIDPLNDYGWDPKEIEQMNSAIMHGIAAGYEALRDAQIPLVRQYTKTALGGLLPDRLALPKNMQKRTGVIYAHSFPLVETVIAEVSRHISYKFGNKLKSEIITFYESLLPAVKDVQAKKMLTEWFTLNYQRLSGKPSQNEVFQFNHQFINQISGLANNRIAQYIQALGPNFQLDAACSSMSTAITLAEEMIKSGRVDRMLVIASDDATSEHCLPYLGGGFLSTGAATCEADLYKAAIPFDQRRNGMIMSSGAAAIVIESLDKVEERGVAPVCELLGTHVFNTGSHPARLDVPKYAEELDVFIGQMELIHGVSRKEIAPKLLYVSHETYTPARGGCSEAEVFSLQQIFGDEYKRIEVTNTKGMTGHTMGTSIEDVLAARSLQMGKTAPVVNFKVPDPKLQGLKLSKGGDHQCEYALRMAAGFGSQGNYLLLKKWKNAGNQRIHDNSKYQAWIHEISGKKDAALEVAGRVLRVAESGGTPKTGSTNVIVEKKVSGLQTGKPQLQVIKKDTAKEVMSVISKITGYPPEMIEEDMEVEGDLGIDTVKQATILSTLSEHFGMTDKVDFKISAYPTVGHLIKLFESVVQTGPVNERVLADNNIIEKPHSLEIMPEKGNNTANEVIKVISEITGYPPEMIEEDMEVESDLGIDTVKQATIVSTLSERFGKTDSVDFKMSAYPTVGHLIKLFTPDSQIITNVENKKVRDAIVKNPAQLSSSHVANYAGKEVIRVIAEITGYPPEMLEEDMEVESDLGIDTVKQATILSTLSERFGKTDSVDFKMSAYPTVGHLIQLFAPENKHSAITEKKSVDDNTIKNPVNISSSHDIIKNAGKEVIKVISEITGYPTEMIEEDMEVEGDLGIDTVKQATILSTLSERFGKTDDVDFKMSAYPTVGHLVKLFNKENEIGNGTLNSPAIVEQTAIKNSENIPQLKTHILELMKSDLSLETVDLSSLSLWILCDDRKKGGGLLDYFKPLFGTVEVKQIDSTDDLTDKADVWIDLGMFSNESISNPSSPENSRNLHAILGNRFDFCKKCVENVPKRILLCRTSTSHAWNSLLKGFYQSVAKEWNAHFSSIEVKQSTGIDGYTSFIEKELRTKSDGICIVYDNNERYVQKFVPSQIVYSIKENKAELNQSDVILITGGGNGITSRIATELASKIPAKYVIFGRSELSNDDYTTEKWDSQNLDQRKVELRELIAKTGRRATPALIEEAVTSALKQRELQCTLKKFKELGRELEYMNCDITSYDQLKKCIEKITTKWGKVTSIIHGAGFEKSQLLSKKDKNEFFSVVDVKVIGAMQLLALCSVENLKLWVSMSSISGIFGNEAQTDYSSANAFLNGLAEDIAMENSQTNSLALAWSGWSELGMAWRNTYVRQNSQSMGLFLIPPTEGAAAAVNAIKSGCSKTVNILHCGLGAMVTDDWQPKLLHDVPLLEKVEMIDSNTLRAFKTVSVETDEWINQHRLEDVPIAPGVGMMEMIAETFVQTSTFENGIKFENLGFHDALKLYKNKSRKVLIEAEGIYSMTQNIKLYSEFSSKLVKNPELRTYCTAIVSAVNSLPSEFNVDQWKINTSEKTYYDELLPKLQTIPNNVDFGALFHESKSKGYQSHTDWIEWDSEKIHSRNTFPTEQFTNKKYELKKYIINFCLLDFIHQTGVIHTVMSSGKIHLPFSAREFVVFGKQDNPGTYHTYAKLIRKTDEMFVYDIFLIGPQNNVCAYALGSTYHRIQG
jgi:acyl transferase domain-containing protein/NAD(P)-dependent dehydrogenase (short-subunit alcohol dehydrogenase family)/acyl carrier protein